VIDWGFGTARPLWIPVTELSRGHHLLKFVTEKPIYRYILENNLTSFSQKALKLLVVFAKTLDFSP